MVRRSLESVFVGGAHVFPGGALDPGDGDGSTACDGIDDAAASRILGIPAGGLAYWVAAVRESFEEAGVLIARERPGAPVLSFAGSADVPRAARLAAHRRALNAKSTAFGDVLRAEGLQLALDRVHYVAHWVTPEGSPRRYDTRFFVTAAPRGQVAAHDASETISHLWIRPADALAQHQAGKLHLVLPTIRNLEALTASPTTHALFEAVTQIRDVPTVRPRLAGGPGRARLLMPGDPGYDDPAIVPPDPEDLDALSRAVHVDGGPHR